MIKAEILNLQPKQGKAKAYQVKQIRIVILKYQLGGQAYVIVSATFGHLQDSSLELSALKPCPVWITPY